MAPPLGLTPFAFWWDLWNQKTRIPGLLCGVLCVILHLAVSVEHWLVTDKQTDRQTQDYGIYHANMASCGKTRTVGTYLNVSVAPVKNSSITTKYLYLILTFRSHHPVEHKLSVVRTLLERSQQLVTVSQDKIQEDAHVEEALRACGYPPWSFNKVRRQMEFKGDKR